MYEFFIFNIWKGFLYNFCSLRCPLLSGSIYFGNLIMRKHRIILLLSGILFILFAGCEKWPNQDKYKRPDWLPGKLYTAVSVQKNLSLFAECLRLSGLDTIIDVSGCWTVFAPTDEAMRLYLSENNYSSVSGIPKEELNKITKFHIIQDPWSLLQLKILGSSSWREGENSKPNS